MGKGNGDRETLLILTCGSMEARTLTLLDRLCCENIGFRGDRKKKVCPATSWPTGIVENGMHLAGLLEGQGQKSPFEPPTRYLFAETREYRFADT